ncbi:hypothetical protein E2P64_00005 [Candidatus Bathyarchaeota archaeon]|nr:hypothetical protein E2P64_00005 [Candidatus Bathyarchaeota archaeon]
MSDNLYLWNGTHKAFATPKYFTANSSFVLTGEWMTRMFEARQVYHSSNFTEIVDSPTGDVDDDSLWEKFKSAVFSLVGNIAGVLNLPQGSYSSFGNEVSVALDNGTIRTYGLSLSTPRMGWFTGFWTNVTSGSGWIALNSSETFRIDFNVTGFIYNGTDTLNSFGFKCQNATYSKYMTVTKFSNRSFRIANTTADGKYYCSIYPQWDTALPLTFPTRDLTMYVDSQWPSINDATGPVAISSTVAFNVTVNVTEDSEINLFRVYTNHSSFFPAVSGFTLDETGAYQIYTVTMTVTDVVGIPPALIRLNITAQDYTGKISGNYTVGNMTVYNANPPDTEIINTAPGNNIQDFATVPLNLSIRSLSTDDAKLSWMNATLWQDTLLQAYGEATGINYPNQTLWLNASLSGYNQTYVVQITSVDITGNKRESSIGILRHGSQTITVSGKWFSSITGTLKVYWDNDFTSGTGLRNSQQITDTQTGTNQTDATTYSVKLKTPNVDVDEWYVQANASSTSLKYVRLRYLTAQPSNAVQYVYATSYIYGLNTTDDPDSIIVRGERSMGSSEKMCLKICDEYDVGSGDCDSSWVEEKCASAGVDEYNFVVSGSNDLLDNIGTGTGFWVDKVTITSDTVVDDTGTQTTTGLIGTAVVTITAPTSKSVDVDDCADVTFTIKNTGSASASISSITASGFSTSEMTYTMLSDIDFPYGLGVNQQLQAILSFCPLKADVFNPSVCAKVGSSSKCITVKITGLGEEGEEEEEAELNLTVSVETFNDEYIVLVNTSSGPVEGVTVTITYSDGTIENYTTNVFGKINFVPKLAEFTVKVLHGGETVEKTIQELTEPIGLTLWRILVDLLIIAVLIGFGVLLDEKML